MSSGLYDRTGDLVKKLERYCREKHARKATAAQILAFVKSTENCFERTHTAGHITGSAWLLNPTGDKALMSLHRKLKRWVQPGGHADGQCDTLSVALREAEEESGISGISPISEDIFDIDIHPIPARPGEEAHYHYDIRYLLRAPHENVVISDESDALEWWSAADFAARREETDEAVLRMAALIPGIKG